MILSDASLLELHTHTDFIYPLDVERQIQPASIDLRLDRYIISSDNETTDIFDEPYTLKPQEFVLASTLEYVQVPNNLVCRVDGRSSIGRLGVMVHVTAGYIDPGFKGNITLEIYNVSDREFPLKYMDHICQLVVEVLDRPCLRPYGDSTLNSKYNYSDGVIQSKWSDE